MRNIVRLEAGRTRGWQFRICKKGKNYTKLFSDKKYGSYKKAKAAAISFKKEWIQSNGERPSLAHLKKKNTRAGVLLLKRTKNGQVTQVLWMAHWMANGKQIKKMFSIKKWGYVNGYNEAKNARIAHTDIDIDSNPPEPELWLKKWMEKNNVRE